MKKIIFFSIFLFLSSKNVIAASPDQFLNSSGTTTLPEFLSSFYTFSIAISGLVAVLMIIVGGIYFIYSGAMPDKEREGKDMILGALWGLALLLGSYFILKTINPELVKLKDPGGDIAKTVSYESCKAPEENSSSTGSGSGGITVSSNLKPCELYQSPFGKDGECVCYVTKKWEETLQAEVDELTENGSESDGNQISGGCASDGDLKKIEGVSCSASDCRLRVGVVEGLKKAEEVAKKQGENLDVYSAFRSMARQTVLFDAAVKKYGSEAAARKWVAKPSCGAPHVQGVAIDARLKGRVMNQKNKALLQQIMKDAGWVRYCAEWWHFQYGIQPKVPCSP
jgi:hypothetical protein